MNGVEAGGLIRKNVRQTVIIMLTVETDSRLVLDSIQCCVNGYLLKDTPADRLREKIHIALQGAMVISDAVSSSIVDEVNRLRHASSIRPRESNVVMGSLTQREKEVLYLVAEGCSNEEIAGELFLSMSTVKKQVASIMQKFGATNRVQLATKAIKMGLVE
jgi:DNA-binding NarL/FixJ family response regulator